MVNPHPSSPPHPLADSGGHQITVLPGVAENLQPNEEKLMELMENVLFLDKAIETTQFQLQILQTL